MRPSRRSSMLLLLGITAVVSVGGPLNAARDCIGDPILHVRDNLEERVEAEGRTATAVWNDEIEKPEAG